ncbi:hypothetical protein ELS19_18590 [Halogeometricum borinquense]|uniref:Uncharacterized protein n=1 Tax=Halogeometricum borinquense TaxID=60847 RepID=A0A482T996_9EURY|nr:hypothetical protein [Halogeometricum borinquense]RYJ08519.1 hypothetical protein ELS19_18590 [Halogeometricum borinquense]
MSDDNSKSTSLNRRAILKGSAASAVGLAGLTQPAWAKPTDSEIEQLEKDPNVKAVLEMLGRSELPSGIKKVSSTLGEGDNAPKLEFWEADLEYGTFDVGRLGERVNIVFTFSEDFRSDAPEKFQSIPAGTDPLVGAIEGQAMVKRSTTDEEDAAIRAALPVSESSVSTYTATSFEGFYADVLVRNESDENLTNQRYQIQTATQNHPVFQESSGAIEDAVPDMNIQKQGIVDDTIELIEEGVNTDAVEGIKGSLGHKPWKKIPDASKKVDDLTKSGIKSVVAATIAGDAAEHAKEYGDECVDCALGIHSLAVDCRKCRIFLTTSVSAVGAISAILFVACIYNFCNLPKTVDTCGTCINGITNDAAELA